MPLSDTAIRALKPRDKAYKVTDEKGLYLQISPSGGKLWRFKYRSPLGVERKLSIGPYPEISLKDARSRRDEAKRQLASGEDPAERKQLEKLAARLSAGNTFGTIAEAYIAKNEREGLAAATLRKRRWFLSLLARSLNNRPIADIEPITILHAVKPFEAAKNDEKAHRTLEFIGQVFRYAVANQLVATDPTRDLRGALTRRRTKHLAAITEPKAVGQLLRAIEGYDGQPLSKIALQLSPHVFLRPGELRQGEWSEVDFEVAVWKIPAEKMKGRQEHAVPLSSQAKALLEDARTISGGQKFIFPSIQTFKRPMSENTINGALRRLGYSGDQMTAHGFRAMASTLLNESGLFSADAIERSLAHKDRDSIRAAYHRGQHWNERVKMAQWWSDYLDGLSYNPAHLE